MDFFSYEETYTNKLNFSYFDTWRQAVQMLTYFCLIVPLVYRKPHNLFFLPRFSLVYLNMRRRTAQYISDRKIEPKQQKTTSFTAC